MAIQSLTREQVIELLKSAQERSHADYVMLLLTFSHGFRNSETINLTRDNFSDGFVTVQRLKGSLKTTQPLVEHPDPLLNERRVVIDYIAELHGNQRLFPIVRQTFWRRMQRYAAAAGIPKHLRHPHVLKHSIATQTIHSAGIENVRQYLGHKNISSTGAYVRVDDSVAAAAITSSLCD